MCSDVNNAEYVCQLPGENSGQLFTIKTIWRDDNFFVTLFDGVNAFSGAVSFHTLFVSCDSLLIEKYRDILILCIHVSVYMYACFIYSILNI